MSITTKYNKRPNSATSASDIDKRRMLDTNWFSLTNMTVLASKEPISMVQWRDYLIRYQSSLMRASERILILAGIHGMSDGNLGPRDQGLVKDSLGQIGVLERRFGAKDRGQDWITFNAPKGGENVTVKIMDIGIHLNDEKTETITEHLGIDEKKLVTVVRVFLPTVLVLGFCWTEKSVLNDLFRSAGVYSILILNRDRREITQDRCIFLDEQQTKIIDVIATENPQNVMFWGIYGTGKTLMLLEAARIKVAHHKRRRIKDVEVTFLVYNGDCGPFVHDLMTKYDLPGVDITYESDLKNFCSKINVPYTSGYESDDVDGTNVNIYGDPMTSLPILAKAISEKKKDNLDKHSILVVDEIPSSKYRYKADWSKFETSLSNVDLVFSLDIPLWPFDYHEIKEPQGDSILSFKLEKVYRNSHHIQKLIFFAYTHDDHFDPSKSDCDFGQPSINAVGELPPGNVPVRLGPDSGGTLRALLEVIRDNFIYPDDSVTLMCFSDDATNEDQEWLDENGWKFCHCAFDDGKTSMRGREEEVVVLAFWPGNYIDYVRIPELVTRARCKFILATSDKVHTKIGSFGRPHNPLVQMLLSAVRHFRKKKCNKEFKDKCPYLGQQIVDDRFAIFNESKGTFRLAPSKNCQDK